MTFGGINFTAVLLATTASFLFGGLWYTAFSRRSLADAADAEDERGRPRFHVDAIPFIIAFVALLIMAYVLAGVIAQLGNVSVRSGILSALLVWAGFVMTSLVVTNMVQGVSHLATLVDGGHWMGVLVIQGAVIGWLGA